jgi:hypothetical protein
MKNKELNNYVVSTGGWDIDVDEMDHKSAAISALLYSLNKFEDKLLISPTIMVNSKKCFSNNSLDDAEFFGTHTILKEIGMHGVAIELEILNSNINEFKHLAK